MTIKDVIEFMAQLCFDSYRECRSCPNCKLCEELYNLVRRIGGSN